MSDGIYSALSGAVAQQRALDVVANNVANVGTVGYRGDRLAFREAVSRVEGGPNPDGLRYVSISQMATDDTSGPLTQTGNPLDVALQGDGLFAVRTDDGVRYTRAGSFRMDPEGVLRTPGGHPLLAADPSDPENPEIRVPRDAGPVQIGADGTVSVGDEPLARIRIERFDDGALQKEGLTLFVPRGDARGEPATETQVLQGHLEGANVSPIAGMNELITASRSFEAFQRVIQAFRQIDQRAARDVGADR
ncbi:MAG TPA: flagellar basal-body rod protein FlgF [Sandaracinaceae bacterium LLY-WYZ-13_1]|nr:flagellar basal-body rod protein FlgF [Sandaracinaceae bacterium LLY-WYZ-13_1]